MGFELVKVKTHEDLERFICLPWEIYKGQPYWVPPLIHERERFLNPEINPFFEHAEVDFFLAIDSGGSLVGRIALIHDQSYQDLHSEPVGMFGMFESMDDLNLFRFLLDKAYQWCREIGRAHV